MRDMSEPRTSYLIARLDRLVRSRLSEALRPFGVSVTQYTLLSVLARRPGLSNAQLARRSYITAQAMHQVVNGLEERGLIERETSPEHGRIQMTQLTEEGIALVDRCEEAVTNVEQELFDSLSPEEESDLRRLLLASIRTRAQDETSSRH